MKIILIGAPGSGKGTQAQYLTDKYHVPKIATGDLLRAAVTAHTPLGRQAKTIMDAGQIVPNDIIIGMIRERITRPDADQGFILDSFPRNIAQAIALDDILDKLGKPIDAVLQFDVGAEILMQRMIGRLTCISCGALFNLFTKPPAIDDKCDDCDSTLHHRSDDNDEAITERRLRVFESLTQPLSDHYKQTGVLHIVEANGDVSEVTKRVKSALRGLRPKRTPVKPMLEPIITTAKNAKPKVKHVRVVKRQPKLRPRKKIQTVSGNTTIKKLNIEKKLPDVIHKKLKKVAKKKVTKKKISTKKAIKKKTVKKKATSKKKVQSAALNEQLTALKNELKQTRAQLKATTTAEKALLKTEKNKEATLKKSLKTKPKEQT